MPSIAGSREMGAEAAAPPSRLGKYVSFFGGILPYRRSLLSRDVRSRWPLSRFQR